MSSMPLTFSKAHTTLVKDNVINNTDNAAIIVFTADNTIENNTINEAAIGLLLANGNSALGNLLFNTSVTQEPFVPGASIAPRQDSLLRMTSGSGPEEGDAALTIGGAA